MDNFCPFCAAEFVDLQNVMVILLTHISFRKKIDIRYGWDIFVLVPKNTYKAKQNAKNGRKVIQ